VSKLELQGFKMEKIGCKLALGKPSIFLTGYKKKKKKGIAQK